MSDKISDRRKYINEFIGAIQDANDTGFISFNVAPLKDLAKEHCDARDIEEKSYNNLKDFMERSKLYNPAPYLELEGMVRAVKIEEYSKENLTVKVNGFDGFFSIDCDILADTMDNYKVDMYMVLLPSDKIAIWPSILFKKDFL